MGLPRRHVGVRLPHQGETEPVAAIRLAGALHAVKGYEDRLALGLRYARPLVAYVQLDTFAGGTRQDQCDRCYSDSRVDIAGVASSILATPSRSNPGKHQCFPGLFHAQRLSAIVLGPVSADAAAYAILTTFRHPLICVSRAFS